MERQISHANIEKRVHGGSTTTIVTMVHSSGKSKLKDVYESAASNIGQYSIFCFLEHWIFVKIVNYRKKGEISSKNRNFLIFSLKCCVNAAKVHF